MARPRVPAAIFDVDGTLVDVSSVRHHVMQRPKRFDRFHAEAIDCPPHPLAVDLARKARDDGMAVLVVTARKESWRFHTLLWLREQGIEHDAIYMRGVQVNRKDYDVKADLLRSIQRRYDVRLAVDDNPNVIRLWQEHGIPTITVPGVG